MFTIETLKDIKLASRAMREGWDIDRAAVVAELMNILQTGNTECKLEAAKTLIRADLAELKHEEVAIKKQAADDERKLRLLEYLRSLPPGDVAKIASDHKAAIDG